MVSNSISIPLLITTFFSTILSILSDENNTTSPTVIRTFCGNNRSQNPESFDVNFVNTMEIISSKIADNGFGTAVSGNSSSDPVYGLGQCFGYLSSIDCRLCYVQSRVKLPLCLPATSARIFVDGCFLAYADYNFSDYIADNSDTSVCGSNKIESNLIEFREITSGLVQNLSSEAYLERNYYKAGRVSVSKGMEVYGIAECWRSLNMTGCEECLESARKSVVGCFPATDGKALNTGCYVRYSTEPFYEGSSQASGGSSVLRRRLKVALASVLASLVVIGGAILWAKRRASTTSPDDMDDSSDIIRSISESRLSFKYEDLRKATNNFDQGNKLGQGGYGSVYKGILPDGREIAVKRLFFNTRQWVDQFFNEINLISQVQHKNLVKLLGCSVEGPESLLVYEYLRNTSLDRFLFDPFKKKELDWGRRFNIIVGTAEGLAYLHEASEIRIIHRDIKSSNILLDEGFKPKIADFGLARYFANDQSHLSTGLAGTLGYMAPEYVVHGQLTEKADIYSYGILVLEVVTGRKNGSQTTSEGHSLMSQIWGHYTSKTLTEMLDPCLHDQCSEELVLNVFHVGLLCTQASPNLRPPMWRVVEMLISKARNIPLPTQPPFINIKGAEFRNDGSEACHQFSSSSKSTVSVNQLSLSIIRGR
ncbi:cysteine-rich receptor-like protein kinase 2 [Tasmannia lanceolata]|uniref:cysteine-rich receptor-like protein kinase 2 n=1 Tax=Tasmannia lanceolata TaxID=3420 RepID=UPI0040632CB6